MPYPKCKVYNDGSHYIAIPHTTRPKSAKRQHCEEMIEVTNTTLNSENDSVKTDFTIQNGETTVDSVECSAEIETPSTIRKMTRRQLFDELYAECKDLNKKERKAYILARIKRYFPNEETAMQYVNAQFDRLQRNAIVNAPVLLEKSTCKLSTIFARSLTIRQSIRKKAFVKS